MIYEIAGLPVEMNPRYHRLLKQSESYRLSEHAGENPEAISVKTSGVNPIITSAITPVMKVEPDPYDESHVIMETPSEEEKEYICCSAAFCRKIIEYGRFFLHASAIVYEGEAYLFSGTGKSTHTALWRKQFPESYILNDDKPVIQPEKEQITVWGTPFAGKTDLHVNRAIPLKGICFLKQGRENHIQSVEGDRALALLLDNTWRPDNSREMLHLFDMLEQVVARTKIYEMSCTREPEAAQLSYRVMKGDEDR